ncbi:MAG: protein kinase [Deltaproteobacteria bacterium]|nr:protein kinase [Deltaproteobacteria bacterium]MBK8717471.1 protein kinase [Deltaproteobacteria bacterium]MBP7289611.1 protein kinase [Nannocystaceae bacterium]
MFEQTIFGPPLPSAVAPSPASVPTRDVDVPVGPQRDGDGPRLVPGERVPGTRYRLCRWLGDGGMGVVYEAEQVDLERRVALKILRSQIADCDEQRERLRREAALTTKIASPYVVQVLDFGVLPDSRVFYTMELLAGAPLSREIDAGAIAPARSIGLLRQMCAGLAAAHQAGIIHCDVKPENVIVVADRRHGRDCVKLLDFGIAGTLHDLHTRRKAGTPGYMAPEQIEGTSFDARIDIYALGCTAYEMLSGRPPFQRETPLEIVRAHLEADPRPLTELAVDVPPALAAVVMRCIAKQPDDRYASMAELEAALCEAKIAAGLRTAWDDLPLPEIDATRRGQLEARMPRARANPMLRHHRVVAMVSAAVASLSLVLWLSSSVVGAADHERVEQAVASIHASAQRGAFEHPGGAEAGDTADASVVTLAPMQGPAPELARATASDMGPQLADDLVAPDDRAREVSEVVAAKPSLLTRQGHDGRDTTDHAGGRVRAQQGRLASSAAAAPAITTSSDSPADVAPSKPSRIDRSRARALVRTARRALAAGERERASEGFERALALDPRSAPAMLGLSEIRFDAGDHARALHYARRASQLAPSDAAVLVQLGDCYFKVLDREAARRAYQRADGLGHRGAAERLRRLEGSR